MKNTIDARISGGDPFEARGSSAMPCRRHAAAVVPRSARHDPPVDRIMYIMTNNMRRNDVGLGPRADQSSG